MRYVVAGILVMLAVLALTPAVTWAGRCIRKYLVRENEVINTKEEKENE